jgi:hypothetical protein
LQDHQAISIQHLSITIENLHKPLTALQQDESVYLFGFLLYRWHPVTIELPGPPKILDKILPQPTTLFATLESLMHYHQKCQQTNKQFEFSCLQVLLQI